jgi:hypothetical protein
MNCIPQPSTPETVVERAIISVVDGRVVKVFSGGWSSTTAQERAVTASEVARRAKFERRLARPTWQEQCDAVLEAR